jgi:hypothetical protein
MVGSPTQAQIDDGTCFQDDPDSPVGGWWILAADVDVTGPARSQLEGRGSKGGQTLTMDRAGGYVIRDGQVVRDASAVVGSLTGDNGFESMVRTLVPRGRGESPTRPGKYSRRTRGPSATARALVLALLSPRLGERAGARCILRWDEELAVIDRNGWRRRERATLAKRHDGGALTRDFGRGAVLDERADRLDTAEVAIITNAKRIWRALGIEVDPPSSRAGE